MVAPIGVHVALCNNSMRLDDRKLSKDEQGGSSHACRKNCCTASGGVAKRAMRVLFDRGVYGFEVRNRELFSPKFVLVPRRTP